MKQNKKITIIFPLINPDDIAVKTIQSLINQKFDHTTREYQDFIIKIFLNNCKISIKDLVKKYEIFGHKKVEIKRYDKDYGQFKNLKKCFRNIDSDYFIITTKGIFYSQKFIHSLIKPLVQNSEAVFSTCEFGICDENGKEFCKYPLSKTKNFKIENLFKKHFRFVGSVNSAGTKINGIFKSSILKKLKFSNNLDWDKLFLYQASLCGSTNHLPIVLASKLIKKKLIRNIKIATNSEGYDEIFKNFDQSIFHHRAKIRNRDTKNILLTKDWMNAESNYEVLLKLRDLDHKNLFNIFIKYDSNRVYEKQLFSVFYKKYPKYLGYYEIYNFYLYVRFLFSNLRSNKRLFFSNFYWALKSISLVLKRKKIFSFTRSSFLKLDHSRYLIFIRFINFKEKQKENKRSNTIFYTATRNFKNDKFRKNKLSGAIKSSENLLQNLEIKSKKISIYYPPKYIPARPFKYKEIKKNKPHTIRESYLKIRNKLLNNQYDYFFFQKTLDYQFFNHIGKEKKNITVTHNIEYLHYLKKKYLISLVRQLKKKLIDRDLLFDNKMKYFILLVFTILTNVKINHIMNAIKLFVNNYKFYKKSKFIIKTVIVESIFDKFYKKKIFLFAPVVKKSINMKHRLRDEKFIYLSCIGSGNKHIYGDLQLLNFINFLKTNYDFIYKNRYKLKIMISGDLNQKIARYLIVNFSFLECKVITPNDNLEAFLEKNFVVNFIIDENSTGIRTKFYDNIFAGNITVFKDIKQCYVEVFNYYTLLTDKLVFDIENKKDLLNFIEELKPEDLKRVKLNNRFIAGNYNENLKKQNNSSLTFINGLN